MIKGRYIYPALIFLLFLISISAASASDNLTEDMISADNSNEVVLKEHDNTVSHITDESSILAGTEIGTFTELQQKIDSAEENTTIFLEKNYKYTDGSFSTDGVTVNTKNLTIDGQSHTLDGNNLMRIFDIKADYVTLKNIFFVNGNSINGGAVYFNSTGDVTNCNFANNSALNGGAIEFKDAGRITNCNFTNNQANISSSYSYYVGGAVHFINSGNVENCNFINNSARNGGAIEFDGAANVKNCNFTDNRVISGWGGAIYFNDNNNVKNCNFTNNKAISGWGGAIYFNSNSDGNVENCNFTNNSANQYGGAIYFNRNGNATDCNFINNSARYGGSIEFDGAGHITDCNFTDNAASWAGGAIYMSKGIVENCNFTDNKAKSNGGAVYIYGNGEVTDCNFTGNNATKGSAIFFSSTSSTKTISNSIFLNNRANADAKTPLNITKNENNIEITFMGQNNIINAIYANGNVSFTDVTYWGANGIANTGKTTITPSRSNREAGQNISVGVVVNDVVVLNEVKLTDENGTIVLDVKVNGDYYIRVRHDEDSYYTEAEKILKNMTFYVNVSEIKTTNKTVNITAKSNIHNETMPGELLFILPNGTEIKATYAANGTWWAVLTFDDYGDYEVNASYIGLDNVTINNATISIYKANSTLDVNDIYVECNRTINVTATTTGATGITAKIGANDLKVDGFTIEIPALDVGIYVLTVTTVPDENHVAVTKNAAVAVRKTDSTLTVGNITFDYKGSGSATVTFTGATGVIAEVVNQSKAVVNVDGNKITVSNLDAGTYTLSVTTIPDEDHSSVTRTADITVNKLKTQISAKAVTATYNVGKNLVITLKDAKGNAISGVKVTVKLKGTKTYKTNKKGQVKVSTKGLAPKKYTAKISFKGDSNYVKSTKNVKVTVKKAKPKIVAKKKTFKKTKKIKKYTIKLKNSNKKAIKKVKVTLKVKGKTYKAKTNKKGKATFKITKLTKKGKFTAKIKFKGNKYYKATSKKVKIKVK